MSIDRAQPGMLLDGKVRQLGLRGHRAQSGSPVLISSGSFMVAASSFRLRALRRRSGLIEQRVAELRELARLRVEQVRSACRVMRRRRIAGRCGALRKIQMLEVSSTASCVSARPAHCRATPPRQRADFARLIEADSLDGPTSCVRFVITCGSLCPRLVGASLVDGGLRRQKLGCLRWASRRRTVRRSSADDRVAHSARPSICAARDRARSADRHNHIRVVPVRSSVRAQVS